MTAALPSMTIEGVQHISRSFQRCLDPHGIVQPASRPGTPLDNAVAESFFKTLKRESTKERSCRTRDEAKQDIFKRIELYHNRVRTHSTLGYISPAEYERQHHLRILSLSFPLHVWEEPLYKTRYPYYVDEIKEPDTHFLSYKPRILRVIPLLVCGDQLCHFSSCFRDFMDVRTSSPAYPYRLHRLFTR